MFIAALFKIAKTWKQPKCPSKDDWIRKMWYIYTTEYYSAIKKNKTMLFATTWMELETLTLSEESQKEKEKYHMIALNIRGSYWSLSCLELAQHLGYKGWFFTNLGSFQP